MSFEISFLRLLTAAVHLGCFSRSPSLGVLLGPVVQIRYLPTWYVLRGLWMCFRILSAYRYIYNCCFPRLRATLFLLHSHCVFLSVFCDDLGRIILAYSREWESVGVSVYSRLILSWPLLQRCHRPCYGLCLGVTQTYQTRPVTFVPVHCRLSLSPGHLALCNSRAARLSYKSFTVLPFLLVWHRRVSSYVGAFPLNAVMLILTSFILYILHKMSAVLYLWYWYCSGVPGVRDLSVLKTWHIHILAGSV